MASNITAHRTIWSIWASHDWVAYPEGHEECGPFGYGATEAEAIANLQEILEDAQ